MAKGIETMRTGVRQRGFSVIEAMISMLAGLIVVGAVLAFTVASVQSNTENVQSTRLQQELRNVMDLVTRELRRAGYDDDAMRIVGQGGGLPPSPFSRIQLVRPDEANSCIVYSYDRPGGTAGVLETANGEVRGIRRIVLADGTGAMEFNDGTGGTPDCDAAAGDYASYPPACNGGWCPLTDPRIVDFRQFELVLDAGTPTVAGGDPISIREIDVWLQGRLASDADVVRGMDSRVRVRTDCIRPSLTDCDLAPGA